MRFFGPNNFSAKFVKRTTEINEIINVFALNLFQINEIINEIALNLPDTIRPNFFGQKALVGEPFWTK